MKAFKLVVLALALVTTVGCGGRDTRRDRYTEKLEKRLEELEKRDKHANNDSPNTPVAKPDPVPVPPPPASKRPSPVASGPWKPGLGMAAAIDDVVKTSDSAKKLQMGFDDIGVSLMGAFLHSKKKINLTRYFDGSAYHLITGTSRSVRVLKLEVFDKNGRRLASYNKRDKHAHVIVREKGRHTLELTMASGHGFVAMAFLKEGGGYLLPTSRLREAYAQIMKAARQANVIAKKHGGNLLFETDSWSLISNVIKPGKYTSHTTPIRASGTMVIVGADGHAQDIDLEVLKGKKGPVAASDMGKNASPMAFLERPNGIYEILTRSTRSRGPAVVTTVLLDLIPGKGRTKEKPGGGFH